MSTVIVLNTGALICALFATGCSDTESSSFVLPPPAPRVFVLPDTIDPTGTEDVTSELNAYLASVPDGSVIQLPAGAMYRAEGTIVLQDRRDLTIEGNNALIFAATDGSQVKPPTEEFSRNWPRGRFHVRILNSSGIVIRNLVVRGANPNAGRSDEAYVPDLESQHAFAIHSSTNVELDHVRATDVYGDFVYIGGGSGDPWNQNIHIHDSHFERNGRQGIAVTRGRDVLIERNYIGETRRATIDLEPSSSEGGAEDVIIRNNEIGRGRLRFIAAAGSGSNVSFTVENNTLHRAMSIDVKTPGTHRRGPIRIVGNTSDVEYGSPNPVIDLPRIDGVVVRDNYQQIQEWRDQVFVRACESTDVDVQNNDVPGAEREVDESATCLHEE